MYKVRTKITASTLAASVVITLASTVEAMPIVLDFEGLGVLQNVGQFGLPGGGVALIEPVGEFYNGGLGGSGSGPGIDFGVEFSGNALALVDADADGSTPTSGNFGGEPTPDTVLFFLTGDAATVTLRDGFVDGFSFFYSSINFAGSIDVFDGPNATGNLLASLNLPTTPFNGAPDPTGQFSPFVPIGVSFDGIAQSIDFGGTINQIGFDNITFGSAVPIPTNSQPPGGGTTPTPTPMSEPGSLALVGLGLFGLRAIRRYKSRLQQ